MPDDRGASPSALLVIPSKLASVGPLGEQVRDACLRLGLSTEAAREVEICVVEAVNNAIEHAYQLADDRQVDVMLESDGERLRLVIRDEGQPMPRGTLKRATAPSSTSRTSPRCPREAWASTWSRS
jgi:serine/threonine-protein kinase RsbW